MSIQRVFRGRVRSNFVLSALLAPAVGCSGSNSATNNGSPSDGGTASADGSQMLIPLEPPDSATGSSGPDGSSASACLAPDLACDAGCLTNDTLNCGACGNVCPGADGGAPTCAASDGGYACGLSCGSGLAACGGACVATATFQTDRNNCGSCGFSCIGGTCIAGACQPWLIANDAYREVSPATDGVNVAYINGDDDVGYVVPLAGGTPLEVANGVVDASGVAIQGSAADFVTWDQGDTPGTENSLIQMSVSDQAASGATVMTGENLPALAVVLSKDGSTAYVELSQDNILACSQQSHSCSSLVTIQGLTHVSTFLVNGLAVSTDYLFFTDVTNGNLWRYQLPAGPLTMATTASGLLPFLAADSTYVYYATNSGGMVSVFQTLQTSSASSAGPQLMMSVSGTLTGLAVDGSNVSVSATTGSGSSMGGFVAYAPLPGTAGAADAGAGGGVATMLYQGDPVAGLAAGGGAVVWVDETTEGMYGQRLP